MLPPKKKRIKAYKELASYCLDVPRLHCVSLAILRALLDAYEIASMGRLHGGVDHQNYANELQLTKNDLLINLVLLASFLLLGGEFVSYQVLFK